MKDFIYRKVLPYLLILGELHNIILFYLEQYLCVHEGLFFMTSRHTHPHSNFHQNVSFRGVAKLMAIQWGVRQTLTWRRTTTVMSYPSIRILHDLHSVMGDGKGLIHNWQCIDDSLAYARDFILLKQPSGSWLLQSWLYTILRLCWIQKAIWRCLRLSTKEELLGDPYFTL